MEYLEIKVVNKSQNPLPKYQTDGSACVDLFSNEEVLISPNSSATIGTGLYIQLPTLYELQIRSRSGMAAKNNVFVLNAPGIVDEDFRGEVRVILFNAGESAYSVKIGDRIAQAAICPVFKMRFTEVENIHETERGSGGFGSTGV
jgi:dUTP pyrophosphatase